MWRPIWRGGHGILSGVINHESNHPHVINILKLKHTFLKQDLTDSSARAAGCLTRDNIKEHGPSLA